MFQSTLSSILLSLLLSGVPGSFDLAQAGSPGGDVPPEALQARRQALLDALDGAPAILSSAGPAGPYAQASDYREDSDFFYLTGLEAPGGWLVLNGVERGSVVLYLPPRSPMAERWTGPALGPGLEAAKLTGISDVRSVEELEADLARGLSAMPAAGGAPAEALLVHLGDPRFREALLSLLPPGAPKEAPLDPFLARLRLVKDREELRRLRKAVEITAEAHREVWRVAKPGMAEYQVEAALEYVFHALGAERVGFTSIVGSGPNGTILHYDKNRRRMEEGELAVVDIGAEFGYYTADLTRTFPVGGTFTPRQAALYELVLGTRGAALEAIRPGSSMREVNLAARRFLEEQSGDLCGTSSCAEYLPHGVSHWLGMDVHDVGGSQEPFVPGMVLTLEPGLYLPEENLGIRVEDDILVTSDGYEVLSEALPRKVGEIEAIMRDPPRWVVAGSGS